MLGGHKLLDITGLATCGHLRADEGEADLFDLNPPLADCHSPCVSPRPIAIRIASLPRRSRFPLSLSGCYGLHQATVKSQPLALRAGKSSRQSSASMSTLKRRAAFIRFQAAVRSASVTPSTWSKRAGWCCERGLGRLAAPCVLWGRRTGNQPGHLFLGRAQDVAN